MNSLKTVSYTHLLKQSGTVGKCPVCGKECTTDIYWGVAY